MEIAATAYDAAESLSSIALRQERKNSEGERAVAHAYDTVSISEEARELSRMHSGDPAEDAAEENGEKQAPRAPVAQRGGGAASEDSAEDDPLEEIDRQIREVQKRLDQAKGRLAEVESASDDGPAPMERRAAEKAEQAVSGNEPADNQASQDEATPAAFEGNLTEMKAVQAEISTLNSQLMTLMQRRAELTKQLETNGSLGLQA